MSLQRAIPLLFLLACADQAANSGGHIAPFDGQTQVLLDQSLQLVAPGLDMPGDAPLPTDILSVINLETGGFVQGAATRSGNTVEFTPSVKWQHGFTYRWSVTQPLPESRRPQVVVPPALLGDATFKAGNGSAILDAGVAEDGALCLLLSRHVVSMPDTIEMTLDEVAIDISGGIWQLRHELDEVSLDLPFGDRGATVVCWTDAPGVIDGASMRVWWGERGPWQHHLVLREPIEMLNDARRSQW
jgi:hypothetical protein